MCEERVKEHNQFIIFFKNCGNNITKLIKHTKYKSKRSPLISISLIIETYQYTSSTQEWNYLQGNRI
jgi:hypothetical protein